jgi:hypothetical protein
MPKLGALVIVICMNLTLWALLFGQCHSQARYKEITQIFIANPKRLMNCKVLFQIHLTKIIQVQFIVLICKTSNSGIKTMPKLGALVIVICMNLTLWALLFGQCHSQARYKESHRFSLQI